MASVKLNRQTRDKEKGTVPVKRSFHEVLATIKQERKDRQANKLRRMMKND